MSKKLSVGVLVAALLMSGALVGVSFAGGGGITQPEEIVLSVDICGDPGPCRFYPLLEAKRHRPTGQVTLAMNPLYDVEGNHVGRLNTSCVASDGPGGPTDWVCTSVFMLKAGPHTERGTVVTTGIYGSGDDNRDVYAITGGTGAYVNVRGYATQGKNFTLNLIP